MKFLTSFGLATALAALGAISPEVAAKEKYVVIEDRETKEHKRPNVETTAEKCAYNEESFKLCGKYGASSEIGWGWEQEFYNLDEASKYYKLRLDTYA
jgi:hypothetical protein